MGGKRLKEDSEELWADEQKRHIRPSLWVRQHNMFKPLDQEIR
jgi:hypothetical protein